MVEVRCRYLPMQMRSSMPRHIPDTYKARGLYVRNLLSRRGPCKSSILTSTPRVRVNPRLLLGPCG